MFDWLDARAPRLLPAQELTSWPGGGRAAAPGEVVRLSAGTTGSGGSSALALSGDGPVSVVPLELGGLLVVSRLASASEDTLSAHLDLLPVTGWTILPDRFVSRTNDFALFDSTYAGRELGRQRQRWVPVSLDVGRYEVETYGSWRPDGATHVHLVRLIRTGS